MNTTTTTAAAMSFVVVPVRDTFAGTFDGMGGATNFEECPAALADQWAVYAVDGGAPGPELIEDYPDAGAAHIACALLYRGESAPKPDWSVTTPAMLRTMAANGLTLQANGTYRRTYPDGAAIEAHGPGGADAPTVEAWQVNAYGALQAGDDDALPVASFTGQAHAGSFATALERARRALQEAAAVAAMPADMRAHLLDEIGMTPEMSGGGCYRLRFDAAHGSYLLVTCCDGGDVPGVDDWHVGAYRGGDDGEDGFLHLTSDVEGKAGVTLRMAVAAALAALAEFPGPGVASPAADPGDSPIEDATLQAVRDGLAFVEGFEGDALQVGVAELVARLRDAVATLETVLAA